MTEQDESSPSGARATRPPVHPGDLEEGRTHKIISNRNIRVKRHQNYRNIDTGRL